MPQVTHVVLVAWRDGRAATAEEAVRPAIRAFPGAIDGVMSVVEGPSTSPEGLEGGHHYGFVVTFESPGARDAYLTDPTHQVVADAIGASAERVLVFDI